MTYAEPPGRWSARKVRRGQRRGPDALLGHGDAAGPQAGGEIAARVDGVVREDQEGDLALAQAPEELRRARDRLLLVDEHTVHVHQP
jgi:hypothetical protein